MTTSAKTTANAVLVIDGVTKTFDEGASTPVLDDVSLQVGQGEFLSIVGPSGCGKTTLLRIIQGLEQATEGRIDGSGQSGTRMSYVFQRPSLLPWLTVRENVAFGLTLRSGRRIEPSKAAARRSVDELLGLTGLTRFADYYPVRISGGMQQRVNLARALAVRPTTLLMDEPFSALDAMTRERLQIDVSDLLSQLGTSLILVTHDIREAVFLSDRILVMSALPGRIAHEVTVPVARPRAAEFQHSDQLANLERDVWHRLHG